MRSFALLFLVATTSHTDGFVGLSPSSGTLLQLPFSAYGYRETRQWFASAEEIRRNRWLLPPNTSLFSSKDDDANDDADIESSSSSGNNEASKREMLKFAVSCIYPSYAIYSSLTFIFLQILTPHARSPPWESTSRPHYSPTLTMHSWDGPLGPLD